MLETKLARGILWAVLLSFTAIGVKGANILFVTDDPANPSEGDTAVKNFFEVLGHKVTYIDDDKDEAKTEAAAAAADLVYISESVSSEKINNEITEIRTPMIVAEPHCFDEMGMSGVESQNQSFDSSNVTIVKPDHPLAAGYRGEVAVMKEHDDSARIPGPSVAGGEAVVIAKGSGNKQDNSDVYFVYDQGAPLAGPTADGSPQVAADIRIGFFAASPQAQALLSPQGYGMLKAAVSYALGASAGLNSAASERDGVNTLEDTPVSITLIGSDPDGDPLTYHVVTGPSYGHLSGTAPKLIYTPPANFNGLDSFTFTVNDGKVDSVPVTVLIMVIPVNDPPIADEDSVTTQEGTQVSITLVGSDVDGDALSYSVVKGPVNGSLSGTGPDLIYTPNAYFNGSDSFTFKVSDGTVDSPAATVSIKVHAVNNPPVGSYVGAVIQKNPPEADDGSVTTEEDTPVSITLEGSDPDGDKLTYTVVTCPSHGSLSGIAPNLTYTPDPDFSGPDSLTFKVSDETADSAAATVSITVKAVNDSPAVDDDRVTTEEDTPAAAIDVLANDSDIDDDPLEITEVTQGENGSVTINDDNTLSYSPDADFSGTDSFTYTVCDGAGGSDTATVNVTVEAANDSPTANDGRVTVEEDTPVSITLSGSDPDGDSLDYNVVDGPSHGSLSGTAPNVTYTPNPDFNGSDRFTFKVGDGTSDSDAATVSITVTAVNDKPTAADDRATTEEESPTAAIDVLANDSDIDDDPLEITAVTQGGNGSVTINADNTLSYSPRADFSGTDSFTYTVCDGEGGESTATVNVTVEAVNDAPTANDGRAATLEDKPVSIGLRAKDVDGDELSYVILRSPSSGRLSGTAPKLTYTPKENFHGSDRFLYRVSDGSLESRTATVLIAVEAANDAPTAHDDSAATKEDSTGVIIDVLANDTDMDGDSLKVTGVSQGKNGSVTVNADNTLNYTPKADFYGADSFTYTVSDGKGGTNRAVVKIEVRAVNDSPKFVSTPVTTATVDELYTYNVNAADPDLEDALTYSLAVNPTGMTIDTTTGLIEWTPTSAEVGANDVVVKVSDSGNIPASDTQSFTIIVGLASAPVEPATTALPIADSSNQKGKRILLVDGTGGVVQASDDNRGETDSGLETSFDFSDISIPADAVISSVVVYVEHFEQEGFPDGKLQWAAGTGWPENPVVWASMNAPLHEGEPNEVKDSWDVTGVVNTPEKVNALQLQIKNDDQSTRRKTFIDYIYVVVDWY
jgi:hypothetical protein